MGYRSAHLLHILARHCTADAEVMAAAVAAVEAALFCATDNLNAPLGILYSISMEECVAFNRISGAKWNGSPAELGLRSMDKQEIELEACRPR